jgi:hypothetical protein
MRLKCITEVLKELIRVNKKVVVRNLCYFSETFAGVNV